MEINCSLAPHLPVGPREALELGGERSQGIYPLALSLSAA